MCQIFHESNMKVFLFFICAMCSVDTLLLNRMRSVYGKLHSTCYVLKSNWRHNYSCSTGIQQTLRMSSDDIGGQKLSTCNDKCIRYRWWCHFTRYGWTRKFNHNQQNQWDCEEYQFVVGTHHRTPESKIFSLPCLFPTIKLSNTAEILGYPRLLPGRPSIEAVAVQQVEVHRGVV